MQQEYIHTYDTLHTERVTRIVRTKRTYVAGLSFCEHAACPTCLFFGRHRRRCCCCCCCCCCCYFGTSCGAVGHGIINMAAQLKPAWQNRPFVEKSIPNTREGRTPLIGRDLRSTSAEIKHRGVSLTPTSAFPGVCKLFASRLPYLTMSALHLLGGQPADGSRGRVRAVCSSVRAAVYSVVRPGTHGRIGVHAA